MTGRGSWSYSRWHVGPTCQHEKAVEKSRVPNIWLFIISFSNKLFLKENIIGGIFDILHWASWADYIGYIGLTPYVDTQCGTIPIYSNIPPAVTIGAL